MKDKEFIPEALERLIPKSEWHGESNIDRESLENIDLQWECVDIALRRLFEDIVIPGQEGNGSAEAIKTKKRKYLEELIYWLDDLPELVGYKIVKVGEED